MPLSDETLYLHMGRLVEAMPDIVTPNSETIQWLARAVALAEASGETAYSDRIKLQSNRILKSVSYSDREEASRLVQFDIYQLLGKAEISAPISMQGAFIPAGNTFDAFAAFRSLFAKATREILIVDPYMDERCLTDFVGLAPEQVSVRLLSDKGFHKPTLKPAVDRWIDQNNALRPLSAKLTPPKMLHDRLLVIDGTTVWMFTQSLKDFAVRSPASIVAVDADMATLKIPAYENLWATAAIL